MDPQHILLKKVSYGHWEAQLPNGQTVGPGPIFREAHFQRVGEYVATDFFGVGSLEGAYWYGAVLDRNRMRRDSLREVIGDELGLKKCLTASSPSKGEEAIKAAIEKELTFRRASEAYLALKHDFNSIGRYDDVSWAYYREQQMERMSYFPITDHFSPSSCAGPCSGFTEYGST